MKIDYIFCPPEIKEWIFNGIFQNQILFDNLSSALEYIKKVDITVQPCCPTVFTRDGKCIPATNTTLIWSNKIRTLPSHCNYNDPKRYTGFEAISAQYLFHAYAEDIFQTQKSFCAEWLIGCNDFLQTSELTSKFRYLTESNLSYNKVPFNFANVEEVIRINSVISVIASKRLSGVAFRNLNFSEWKESLRTFPADDVELACIVEYVEKLLLSTYKGHNEVEMIYDLKRIFMNNEEEKQEDDEEQQEDHDENEEDEEDDEEDEEDEEDDEHNVEEDDSWLRRRL